MWLCALLLCGCPPKKDVLRELEPDLPDAAASGPDTSRRATVRGWYLKAAVARERGDDDMVLRALGWVRRLEDPRSPWPYVALGREHERLADWTEAIGAYERAIALDEACAEAHLGLGRVMLGRGVAQAAVHHLQVAQRLAASAEAHELMVRARLALGEPALALGALEAWVELASLSREEGTRQARLARQVGCEALGVTDSLAQRWAASPDVLRIAAGSHEECGRDERAAALRQQADALGAAP